MADHGVDDGAFHAEWRGRPCKLTVWRWNGRGLVTRPEGAMSYLLEFQDSARFIYNLNLDPEGIPTSTGVTDFEPDGYHSDRGRTLRFRRLQKQRLLSGRLIEVFEVEAETYRSGDIVITSKRVVPLEAVPRFQVPDGADALPEVAEAIRVLFRQFGKGWGSNAAMLP